MYRQSYHLLLLSCPSILPVYVSFPLPLFMSCWTEASVVRNTTKISNSVSSPVPSPALLVGPSNQCAVVRVCHLCHAVYCVVSCVVWCVVCVRVFMW